jgi:hypothetical protein
MSEGKLKERMLLFAKKETFKCPFNNSIYCNSDWCDKLLHCPISEEYYKQKQEVIYKLARGLYWWLYFQVPTSVRFPNVEDFEAKIEELLKEEGRE